MKATPELIAKLIFASTQLRYFEKEMAIDPGNELRDIVIKWQFKIDEVLMQMGMDEFIPLKQLIKIITNEETI